mmetsp:Transcript_71980/g.232887  ORF Transcript_71980/g.232887 Transcript_71980/m.232887 type:complete len:229 (-) Transcript_71980:491-1177(-)
MRGCLSETRVAKCGSPNLHLRLQLRDVCIARDGGLEVFELLALLGLDFQRYLAAPVKEEGDLPEVLRRAAARCHRWRTDAHSARGKSGGVTMHGIAVQRYGGSLANLFDFGTRQTMRPEVPEHQVVVRAIARKLVALLLQCVCDGLRVCHHCLRVLHKGRRLHFQELRRQAANLVVVRPSLQRWEDRHVNALLEVRDAVRVLEENHACARATEGLMRRGRNDVAVLEW